MACVCPCSVASRGWTTGRVAHAGVTSLDEARQLINAATPHASPSSCIPGRGHSPAAAPPPPRPPGTTATLRLRQPSTASAAGRSGQSAAAETGRGHVQTPQAQRPSSRPMDIGQPLASPFALAWPLSQSSLWVTAWGTVLHGSPLSPLPIACSPPNAYVTTSFTASLSLVHVVVDGPLPLNRICPHCRSTSMASAPPGDSSAAASSSSSFSPARSARNEASPPLSPPSSSASAAAVSLAELSAPLTITTPAVTHPQTQSKDAGQPGSAASRAADIDLTGYQKQIAALTTEKTQAQLQAITQPHHQPFICTTSPHHRSSSLTTPSNGVCSLHSSSRYREKSPLIDLLRDRAPCSPPPLCPALLSHPSPCLLLSPSLCSSMAWIGSW